MYTNYLLINDDNVKICVLGEPVAKASVRVTKKGTFYPKKTKKYQRLIKDLFIGRIFKKPYFNKKVPLRIRINIFRPTPANWGIQKTKRAELNYILPVTKPDTDNYTKLIKDVLSGVIYYDDNQVCQDIVCKWYSTTPRIEVYISEIKDNKEDI